MDVERGSQAVDNSSWGRMKGPKNNTDISSKLDSFLRRKVFLFLSSSCRNAYTVGDNAKTFTSVGLSCKNVILFSEKPYVFDVVCVKSNSITCCGLKVAATL